MSQFYLVQFTIFGKIYEISKIVYGIHCRLSFAQIETNPINL